MSTVRLNDCLLRLAANRARSRRPSRPPAGHHRWQSIQATLPSTVPSRLWLRSSPTMAKPDSHILASTLAAKCTACFLRRHETTRPLERWTLPCPIDAIAFRANTEVNLYFDHVIRDKQMPHQFHRAHQHAMAIACFALLADRHPAATVPFNLSDEMPWLIKPSSHFSRHVFAINQRRFRYQFNHPESLVVSAPVPSNNPLT